MKLSISCCSLVGALFAGSAAASPLHHSPKNFKIAARSPTNFDLTNRWDDEILFAGVAAPEVVGVQKAIDLGIRLPQAQVAGSVGVSALDDFLANPTLRVDLSNVKIYLELDLSTSAGVYESIQLAASEDLSVAVSIPASCFDAMQLG